MGVFKALHSAKATIEEIETAHNNTKKAVGRDIPAYHSISRIVATTGWACFGSWKNLRQKHLNQPKKPAPI